MSAGQTVPPLFPIDSYSSSRELLAEAFFRKALYWERQRSERSGNSLLLALLHFDGPKWNDGEGRLRSTIAHSVCQVIRETDTIGWYTNTFSLGVIFTELRESNGSESKNSIEAKFKTVLCAALPARALEDVRISYHSFPEGDGDVGSRSIFYPEGSSGTPKSHRILKRCIDVTGSLLALIALSPLLFLIALAIKLTSPGPIWCRQTRIGERGAMFTLLKFRTMFDNNDPTLHRDYVTRMIAGQNVSQVCRAESGIYKLINDPRVTAIGRILRRSSLDELPQFLNVLKGDMSLVGPRPPLLYEVNCYSIWHRRRVLEVKPGITGLWQIRGRSRTTFDEMVRLDLQYARNWSLWLDLMILLKTPGAVVSGTGAY